MKPHWQIFDFQMVLFVLGILQNENLKFLSNFCQLQRRKGLTPTCTSTSAATIVTPRLTKKLTESTTGLVYLKSHSTQRLSKSNKCHNSNNKKTVDIEAIYVQK